MNTETPTEPEDLEAELEHPDDCPCWDCRGDRQQDSFDTWADRERDARDER